jgi:hypothetical protein
VPLFGRKKKPGPDPVRPSPDPDLTPLDVEQASWLRSHVRTRLAERGLEVDVFADHVRAADGTEVGLHGIASRLLDERPARWADLVDRHLALVLDPPERAEDLSRDELDQAVHLRLSPYHPTLAEAWPSAGRIGSDLIATLCVDLPQTVQTPAQAFYEERGGLDHWFGVGTGNLRHVLNHEPLEQPDFEPPGPPFRVVLGESVMTASLTLLLDELLARLGTSDVGRGVLVAVPFRHQIAFRVVDGPEALPAVGELARFAVAGHAGSVGSLSPHVYWVHGGRWRQLTSIEDRTVRISIDEDVSAAFGLDD